MDVHRCRKQQVIHVAFAREAHGITAGMHPTPRGRAPAPLTVPRRTRTPAGRRPRQSGWHWRRRLLRPLILRCFRLLPKSGNRPVAGPHAAAAPRHAAPVLHQRQAAPLAALHPAARPPASALAKAQPVLLTAPPWTRAGRNRGRLPRDHAVQPRDAPPLGPGAPACGPRFGARPDARHAARRVSRCVHATALLLSPRPGLPPARLASPMTVLLGSVTTAAADRREPRHNRRLP
jgi:hypothetical protein